MNLQLINKLCYECISYENMLQSDKNKYYTYEYENSFLSNLKKLNTLITPSLIESLNDNYDKYYYIYLFCIKYKEYLLTNDNIVEMLILAKEKNEYELFDILAMNRELNDEIVLCILEKIKKENNLRYLGDNPFDYRYHILRRKEISEKVKEKVLSTYNISELKSILRMLGNDINKKVFREDLSSVEELYKDKQFREECETYTYLNKTLKK